MQHKDKAEVSTMLVHALSHLLGIHENLDASGTWLRVALALSEADEATLQACDILNNRSLTMLGC